MACLAEHLSVSTGKDLVVHRQEHPRGQLTRGTVSYEAIVPVLPLTPSIRHPLSCWPTSIIVWSNWVLVTRNLIVSLLSLDLVVLFPILPRAYDWKWYLKSVYSNFTSHSIYLTLNRTGLHSTSEQVKRFPILFLINSCGSETNQSIIKLLQFIL